MTSTPTPRPTRTDVSILGIDLGRRVVVPDVVLEPGTTADWIRVPAKTAQRLLVEVARLVADLPRDSGRDVVWQSGANELLVLTDTVTLECATGLVTVGVTVSCDQLREPAAVRVPLAVGTTKQVRGLFVSTFAAPDGPEVVTAVWADALIAFAWECLLTLAQRLAAEAGRDPRDRLLHPGAIAAERGALLVKPMARNGA
ncbi:MULTISPECIES: hypothetical protein [unclassified Nocardioides]|uniref:hypothetical protein n=1 Tax=unclassified Nocardioides TaxID=2615069 RepID=UPI0036120512